MLAIGMRLTQMCTFVYYLIFTRSRRSRFKILGITRVDMRRVSVSIWT